MNHVFFSVVFGLPPGRSFFSQWNFVAKNILFSSNIYYQKLTTADTEKKQLGRTTEWEIYHECLIFH